MRHIILFMFVLLAFTTIGCANQDYIETQNLTETPQPTEIVSETTTPSSADEPLFSQDPIHVISGDVYGSGYALEMSGYTVGSGMLSYSPEQDALYIAGTFSISGLEDMLIEGSANWESDTVIKVGFTQSAVSAGAISGPYISFNYDYVSDTISEFKSTPFDNQDPNLGEVKEYVSEFAESNALNTGREIYDIMNRFTEYIASNK